MRKKDTQVGKLVESHGTSMLYVRNYRYFPKVKRLLGVTIDRTLPDIVKGYKLSRTIKNDRS